MKVLVTGGAGFLGTYTAKELSAQGHEPVIFDRAADGDVMVYPQIHAAMEDCDAVIHLAGVLGTSELFARPHSAVDINVKGTINVLDACKRHGTRYVGITMPDCWRNIYQATKLCAQRIAQAYHDTYDVPVCHVRAFNAFGQGQKVKGVQKIVPTFATAAYRGKAIPIWGDGTQRVDLISAAEIARVLVLALPHGDDAIIDAGTGHAWTVNDVAEMIKLIAGSDRPNCYKMMRPGETATDVVAKGDGWDLIGTQPIFSHGEFIKTVQWYGYDRP